MKYLLIVYTLGGVFSGCYLFNEDEEELAFELVHHFTNSELHIINDKTLIIGRDKK